MRLELPLRSEKIRKKHLDPFGIVTNIFQLNKFHSNATGIVFPVQFYPHRTELHLRPIKFRYSGKNNTKYHLNRLYEQNIALINPFVYYNYRTNSFNRIADVYCEILSNYPTSRLTIRLN